MFNNLIVAYLFLGGLGSGACCVLCVLAFFFLRPAIDADRTRVLADIASQRLVGFGFLIASAACMAGAFCLLADMRRPDEILVLLTDPTITVVSVGAYTLAGTIALGIFSGLTWLGAVKLPAGIMRGVSVVHAGLSLAVMAYTALLLMAFTGVPFFGSPLLIALFTVASLSCGAATVVIISVATRTYARFLAVLERVARADLILLLLEGLVLAAFVLTSFQTAAESAGHLIFGTASVPFWTGVVVFGLAIPLVLYALEWKAPYARIHPLLPPVLVLIGGFTLRWCILAAA